MEKANSRKNSRFFFSSGIARAYCRQKSTGRIRFFSNKEQYRSRKPARKSHSPHTHAGRVQFYKKNIIPLIGEKIANNKRAYRYLEQSISQFPHQDVLLTNLKKIGYINPSYTNLFGGIVCIHKATKI